MSGESHYRSKLDKGEVIAIRRRYDNGEKQNDLAEEYDIPQTNVSSVVRGKTWTRVGGPIQTESQRQGSNNPRSKLTEDDVAEIRRRYADPDSDDTQYSLADEFGVHRTSIRFIVVGESWADAPGPIKGEDY